MSNVNITIDGVKLSVPEGMNVLDAALENGIYIPHLCHHKDLNPLGSCRMCIVEVEGQEGVTTSCTLKATEGLVVTTKTPEIERLRMLALELLLAGHPEDCSTCPKYGSCELQMLIQYIGPKTGRLKHRVKGFAPNSANPLIDHDMNRCVLCGRCVRACNELRGVKVLQYNKRDMETYVGTLQDKLLIDSDCRFCQACVEVCPTGTIRDKLASSEKPKEDVVIPCKAGCPAHTDVPRYVRHVKNGEWDEAAAVIREKAPFPHTLGLICNHACELECKRNYLNQSTSIRNIKRYAAEHDTGKYWKGKGKQLPDTGKKVCVVGAGPAGLTAAYYLRKQGHAVTLKEALPTVGGMLSYGIPSYRLPRNVVAEEAAIIEKQGVKIEVNCKVDKPVDLLKEYDAVVM
ncbi:MAG: (2Fe-2S)-binding protein, partial [Pseudobutyrivibrio sp.]|nr:(2Fe-2S)-binding protein [Pseudobutyrivibrio sp.]